MIPSAVERLALAHSSVDRLFFAQVREDPVLEIEALAPAPGRTLVVVGSGGCTALSLLAAGAGQVIAVDLNRTQNHLTELKAAAVATLGAQGAIAFLGGSRQSRSGRLDRYRSMVPQLTAEARTWWDAHRRAVGAGVLNAGVTEHFIAAVMATVRMGIHPPSRVRRLLACRTLDEQRQLYRREWDTRLWHALFALMLNRAVFRKTYHPAFFAHVDNPSFARHFDRVAHHTLTNVPMATNYFIHHMLTGAYPVGRPGGLPPYLDPWPSDLSNQPKVTEPGSLTLVDGGYTDYLRTRPDASVDGFALSNICEWFTTGQIEDLFAEVVRTARPGADLVFRNFLGWTEVPERWRETVVEDRARGEEMITRDRSAVQRRIAVCRVG